MEYNGNKLVELEKKIVCLDQSVSDFHETTNLTLGEIKASLLRIETNIATKANKDDLERIANSLIHKADLKDVQDAKDDIRQIRQNQWGIISALVISLIATVITLLRSGIIK